MKRVAAITLLLLAACKDEGVEKHQKALTLYGDCMSRGVKPTDPCFAGVLKLLEEIPKGSTARPKADAMREALLTFQQPRLRTPLAIQGGPNLAPDVVETLRQCQRLAEKLGQTPEAERPALMRELDACRATAEKLDIAHVHGDEDGGH